MKSRVPLRLRVTLAYGLIGLALSLVFGIATTFVAEDYETILIQALLDGQAAHYQDRLRREPGLALPDTPGFGVFREQEAPPHLRRLPDGVTELEAPGREGIHVMPARGDGPPLVLLIDVGRIEVLETYMQRLMWLVVLGGTALGTWLGWLLAGRTIAPVARLATSVDRLPVQAVATSLQSEFGVDEIGRLAGAIDRYQARLVDSAARERLFFADASHELRTPIAVIQGAVEVLKDDPEASEGQRTRLDRIDRGILELSNLLEALLLSARGRPEHDDEIDLAALCRGALARLQSALPSAPQRLLIVGTGPTGLMAPQRWVACIVAVLFQRLLAQSAGSLHECRLDAEGFVLCPRSDAAAGEGAPLQGDLGLGLMFAERLCRGLGWQLEQQLTPAGLQLSLRIPRPPAA